MPTFGTLTADSADFGGEVQFLQKVAQAKGLGDFRLLYLEEARRKIERDLLSGRGWDYSSASDVSTVDALVASFPLLWKALLAEAQMVILYGEETGEEGSVNALRGSLHAKEYRSVLTAVLRLEASTDLHRTRGSSFQFKL